MRAYPSGLLSRRKYCAEARAPGAATKPFGQVSDDGESLLGWERPGRLEHCQTLFNTSRVVPALGAHWPGVALYVHRARGNARGKLHARGGYIDRETPAHPGDVPIQLIVVAEKPELPIGPVADLVAVLTR